LGNRQFFTLINNKSSHTMQNAQDVVRTDLDFIRESLSQELPRLHAKHLLITGGAGFLGYYLVQSMLHANQSLDEARQVHVTVFDNFIRGLPEWLQALKGNENLTLVRHDITNPLPEDMPDFHYIIHAASIASPTYYRKYPIETMDANVNGLRSLLEYSKRQKQKNLPVEGFLFYSSSEIYGDPSPEHIPTPETYHGCVSTTGPRACYDESKRFGETLCVNFARQHDLPIAMARPFNNYGPGLKISDRRVIPDFARDILADRDIIMLSDGSPTRTFCYVADAVVGYYKILTAGKAGEAYNIGSEAPEVSMADLAERLAAISRELFGYRGKVVRQASEEKNYLVDNPNRRCPDIAKARRELGYAPGVELDEGLRRSLIWYADNRHAEDA
jgi:UDP-glucuronate decarboxylase